MIGPLKNVRDENFAQQIASGKNTATDVYRDVFPSSRRWKPKSVHEKASKKLAKLRPRVREIQEEAAKRVVVTLEDGLSFLADVLKTPAGTLEKDDPLCQEYAETTTKEGGSIRLKMPSKMDAFDKLAKIYGWYAPEKTEETVRFPPDSKIMTLLEE